MKVVSIDSKTGKEVITDIADPDPSFFSFIGGTELSDEEIRSKIDRMNVSADVKALLYSFSKATIKAGKVLLKIGRKIIDIIFSLIKAFPNITFGIIFGLVVGALITAIPVIGFVLGSLATSIAVAFGFIVGAKADFESGDIGARVDALVAEFSPLRA
jgi:hypothetical protein